MQRMTTAEIRTAFLDYFGRHDHQIESSSSLVPANDPSLLFTNAGMNQFKDVFLGIEKRNYVRATTSQRCVRAGGKHNDLENVGYTARHHTFFEMLGNFSFGDYFKEEAISFAWNFLTNELKLPKEKLWITVFEEDLESEKIWLDKIGVDPNRLSRIGAKDNFWSMGDTGPCGPCSEIFFDHGAHVAGGPPGTPEEDGDRYIEIWNLVFMQFNRLSDGTMENLPKPSVDTGMGLERIAAILQGVHSNYEIDIFQTLIHKTAELLRVSDLEHKSLRVIADHIRSCAFLIADGVMPSNEGRGYVLRRIIRRAVRHGHQLGANQVFFYKLVDTLIEVMGTAAEPLLAQTSIIKKALKAEEEQFVRTLERGMQLLHQELETLDGKVLSGEVVFKLYDTYGFPMDLTADICREKSIDVEQAGFEKAMQAQRTRAQAANQFETDYNESFTIDEVSSFKGYTSLQEQGRVVALFKEQQAIETAIKDDRVIVVLDDTPFYPESGGQVGDQGVLRSQEVVLQVVDTQKIGEAIAHICDVQEGTIELGTILTAEVNLTLRKATTLNHSATHLLHAALRKVLGEHVMQKGSLVRSDLLRFDFSHFEAMAPKQIKEVENLVNQQLKPSVSVETALMDLEQAKESGAMALFGEKYDDEVRVVTMGDFSVELCGGTHVHQLDEIQSFKLLSEKGIAAGVRRIEAVTGEQAAKACRDLLAQQEAHIQQLKQRLEDHQTTKQQMLDELMLAEESTIVLPSYTLQSMEGYSSIQLIDVFEKNRALLMNTEQAFTALIKDEEKALKQLKAQLSSRASSDLMSFVQDCQGVAVLIHQLEESDPKSLRSLMDELKQKIGSGVIVLALAQDTKVHLIAGVTKDLVSKVQAGKLISTIASSVGGKGGGRPDMAQAGGSLPDNIPEALQLAHSFIKENL